MADGGPRPPPWVPDGDAAACGLCGVRFGLVTRRHHCRACGGVFCHACAAQRLRLPQHGIQTLAREHSLEEAWEAEGFTARCFLRQQPGLSLRLPLFEASRRTALEKSMFAAADAAGHDYVLTLVAPGKACAVQYNASRSAAAAFARLLLGVKHPYVWPVTAVAFVEDRNRAAILRPFARMGSLRDRMHKVAPYPTGLSSFSHSRIMHQSVGSLSVGPVKRELSSACPYAIIKSIGLANLFVALSCSLLQYPSMEQADPSGVFGEKYKHSTVAPLSPPDVALYARQILEALVYLTARNFRISHLHSGNVLVDKNGCYITDVMENELLGLPLDLTPEAASFTQDVEVLAFGRLLFEMVTGRPLRSNALPPGDRVAAGHAPFSHLLRSILAPVPGQALPGLQDLLQHPGLANVKLLADVRFIHQEPFDAKCNRLLEQVQAAARGGTSLRARVAADGGPIAAEDGAESSTSYANASSGGGGGISEPVRRAPKLRRRKLARAPRLASSPPSQAESLATSALLPEHGSTATSGPLPPPTIIPPPPPPPPPPGLLPSSRLKASAADPSRAGDRAALLDSIRKTASKSLRSSED
eukprot:SM000167S02937  [mRNA]  locus=s167:7864:12495:+ [translate_table: standard]